MCRTAFGANVKIGELSERQQNIADGDILHRAGIDRLQLRHAPNQFSHVRAITGRLHIDEVCPVGDHAVGHCDNLIRCHSFVAVTMRRDNDQWAMLAVRQPPGHRSRGRGGLQPMIKRQPSPRKTLDKSVVAPGIVLGACFGFLARGPGERESRKVRFIGNAAPEQRGPGLNQPGRHHSEIDNGYPFLALAVAGHQTRQGRAHIDRIDQVVDMAIEDMFKGRCSVVP